MYRTLYRMKWSPILILSAALIVVLSACSAASPAQPTPQVTALPALLQVPNVPDSAGQPDVKAQNVQFDPNAPYVASDPILLQKTGKPKLVEFFAFWCEVCQSMRPTMHALQAQYNGMVDFVFLDIDAEATKQAQKDLTFSGLRPTIIFFNAKNQEVGRTVGYQEIAKLQTYLDNLVAQG